MAISSVGIGSGLDVESIITQMVALEKSSLTTLEAKAETIQSKISTYGQIKSLVDDLNSAARDLTLDSGFGAVKINSSNTSVVNATMTGLASQGSYNIHVDKLATSQTSASVKLGAADTLGVSGVLKFSLGNAGNSSTTLVEGSLDITSTDTLTSIVGKINSDAKLSKTVIASVITDSAGKQQLMVRSRETGLDNQFSLSLETSDTTASDEIAAWNAWNSLSAADKALQPEPALSSAFAKLAVTNGISQTQAAANAKMSLNGVQLESNTNTFKDIIPGLSITVSEEGKSSLLSITQDKDATKDKIQKFVDAYNAVNDLMSQSTKYDADSGVKGVLQGDSSTVSLQNSLRMMTQGIASRAEGAFTRLSDIGIEMKQGGSLALNATKLTTALDNMDAVKSLFAAKPDALGNGGGIAVSFKSLTDSLLAWEGTLNSKTDSLENQLDRNKTEQEKVNTRADTVETRLRKQYSALDGKMASLSSLSSYVEQMVASWNKSKD